MRRRALLFWFISMVSPCPLWSIKTPAQQLERRDGNWWREVDQNDRLRYAVGFMDGMELGKDFCVWGMSKTDKTAQNCKGSVVASYSEMSGRYFGSVTSGQLCDGLNDFYDDYRNRSLLIFAAVWLVIQGIAGVSKDQLDKSTEQWRKNASRSP